MPVEFNKNNEIADIEEERRCAFVGITRARERIYLSHHKQSEDKY